jgi:hypothetical protein
MLQLAENVFLGHDIFLLMLFDDIFFLKDLHGVDLLVDEVANQQDLGVCALSYNRDGFIVLDADLLHVRYANIMIISIQHNRHKSWLLEVNVLS